MDRVSGYCPMGCGETLFLGTGGHVTCSWQQCPNPAAVTEILDERETEHLVRVTEQHFNVIHPLHERIGHKLLDCHLVTYMKELTGAPLGPGIYRVSKGPKGTWRFRPVRDA